MATMAVDGHGHGHGEGLSMGNVFGGAIDAIRAWPAQTLGVMFVLGSLPWTIIDLIAAGGIETPARDGTPLDTIETAGVALGVVLVVLIAVAALVALTAVTQAAVLHGLGQRPDLGMVLRKGMFRALPLLVVYILYWIGISFGLALLFVPGVLLGVMWSVAGVAIVAERPGVFGAFARSRDLTRGARWRVFGVLLVGLVVYGLASSAGVALASLGGGGAALLARLLTTAVTTVSLTWVVTLWASLYVQLRRWKDGPETQALADIFA